MVHMHMGLTLFASKIQPPMRQQLFSNLRGIPVVPSEETGASHRSDPAHVFLSELGSCLGALGAI